jgi:hypothetical protein
VDEQSHIAENERAASKREAAAPSIARPDPCEAEAEPTFIIETDLPKELPVTREMLDVMERYFGDLIDEILGAGRL